MLGTCSLRYVSALAFGAFFWQASSFAIEALFSIYYSVLYFPLFSLKNMNCKYKWRITHLQNRLWQTVLVNV